MNNALSKFFSSLLCLLASAILQPGLLHAQVNGNATISSTVFGQTLTLSTKTEFAGAVTSLVWNNKQFVDSADHGREFQSAASFFQRYECYNPTEAGAQFDPSWYSSSRLLWLNASSGILESQTLMAFWRTDNGADAFCGDRSHWEAAPPFSGQPSNYQLHKKITLGFAGIPNAIEYLTDLWIPEYVTSGQVQSLDAIMPYEFAPVWNYDVISKTYRRIYSTGGEDEFVKVRVADDGHALGFYSPELLQPYDGNAAFRWSHGPEYGGYATMGGLFRFPVFNGPGYLGYRSYMVIGSKDQVRTGLDSLNFQFRNLDPEVFNWKEYLEMYPDVAQAFQGQSGAETHWTYYGINEGRNGSKTFSPSTYLQLYPELGNPGNFQYAIDHYILFGRDEGRSTVKRAEAGFRHGTTLSKAIPYSAGLNANGQLGNGSFTNSMTPVAASGLSQITEVADGDFATLAVKANGTVWAWGSNQYGLLGNGRYWWFCHTATTGPKSFRRCNA